MDKLPKGTKEVCRELWEYTEKEMTSAKSKMKEAGSERGKVEGEQHVQRSWGRKEHCKCKKRTRTPYEA